MVGRTASARTLKRMTERRMFRHFWFDYQLMRAFGRQYGYGWFDALIRAIRLQLSIAPVERASLVNDARGVAIARARAKLLR